LPLDHYLPQDYVPGDKVRLQVYQELAAAREDSHIAVLARRLRDRFGPPPPPADNLLYSLRVKLAAQRAGLTAVGLHGGDLELRLAGASELSQLAQGRRGVRVSPSRITFKWRETPNWKEELLRLLDEIARARTGDEAALASVP
jgi:transcription-repair coupling factor (superfamily II helicase)